MTDNPQLSREEHTPGPWEVRSRHESRGEHTTVTRYVAIPGEDYIEVSRLTDPTPYGDLTARANARLIAAAPDLLAALRDIMPMLAECDCIYSDRDAPLCPCRAARAAIAKTERST